MSRLALDHITAVDCAPIELARVGRAHGCDAICLFLEPMAVLPLMPAFDIVRDRRQRSALRSCMDDLGIALDVAYPFTLAGRTRVEDFSAAMECAAELGAGLLNVLVYDRDPARRLDTFGQFCDLADGFGHRVGVEFYPPSQIASLAAALELAGTVARPGHVGVNVDLLHLMRSGGTLAELATAPAGAVLYGQISDGPAEPPRDLEHEASAARLLPGAGAFDLRGFVAALPEGCPISVEVPRDAAVQSGEPAETRVSRAVEGLRRALA